MGPVEERVLRKIVPDEEEETRLHAVVHVLSDALSERIAAAGLDAKPILVGSVAKGTHLTSTEIDMFVAFPPDVPRETLEKEGLALGDLLDRPVRMYAEHPYTRGWFQGFEVEIVPCYRITDAAQRLSAGGRPPPPAGYVVGHPAGGPGGGGPGGGGLGAGGDRARAGREGDPEVRGAARRRGPGRREPERRERGVRGADGDVRARGPRVPREAVGAVLLLAAPAAEDGPAAPRPAEAAGDPPPLRRGPRPGPHGGRLVPAGPQGPPRGPRPAAPPGLRGPPLDVGHRGEGGPPRVRVRGVRAPAGAGPRGPARLGAQRGRIPAEVDPFEAPGRGAVPARGD